MAKIKWEKDPDEVLDFRMDWLGTEQEKGVLYDDEDTILTSTWIMPTGVTKDSDEILSGDTETLIWISGGTLGVTYEVVNRIATAEGRVHDRTAYLKVKKK